MPASSTDLLDGLQGDNRKMRRIRKFSAISSGLFLPMSEFADKLGEVLSRPVVDATHLSGGFDIKLMWLHDSDADMAREKQYGKQYGIDVDNLPSSLTTALREQLGLRIRPAKVPSKVIFVDRINPQPTEN